MNELKPAQRRALLSLPAFIPTRTVRKLQKRGLVGVCPQPIQGTTRVTEDNLTPAGSELLSQLRST